MGASEAAELRAAVRNFLSTASSSDRVRALMETVQGYDRDTWLRMASELGLHGIAVPEQWGGAGAGAAELGVVFEEMGAALLCSPFFSTVAMAAQALIAAGDRAAMSDYLPAIVDGGCTATLILNGRLDAWDPASVSLTAHRNGDAFSLSGEAGRVLDGHTADLILAAARTEAGISLFAVSADAHGLEREALAGLDRTRKIARIRFDDVSARLIGTDGDAAPGLARASDLAIVALTAEQVGAAQRCLDMAVAYAKERIQFGRAIGSFQAIKHRCADMLVLVEGARSAAMHAAEVADTDELSRAASVAKMVCSEALLQVALDNMRIHGGIGFTWEHDAHLYVRRAKASQLIFGSPDHHAQRLADLVTSSH
ncbi:acyl-CoA dehydrogenase [Mycolicibacterium moriokaense]|uniref:Acyl-CoA dehydrogenase n=1 Tax=Mycolicibacterium moriokaense TaxID=39691 RepID=A0AAD1HF29_9MYCO|nr:acyl-CoA dehydrogenase family protein [Mycolicibacterium moriokaense]MCV7039226.1 acyl-CoA dehydrogenase family protein [Mycolicibacterium moriokaense]ORB26921.1 acyl-CoA dehydrogenase [Mycolicibacterium moriokaense]BBX03746.1 acyl-CoA dehydrogenase [Mycolicibacterium moriokaense]